MRLLATPRTAASAARTGRRRRPGPIILMSAALAMLACALPPAVCAMPPNVSQSGGSGGHTTEGDPDDGEHKPVIPPVPGAQIRPVPQLAAMAALALPRLPAWSPSGGWTLLPALIWSAGHGSGLPARPPFLSTRNLAAGR